MGTTTDAFVVVVGPVMWLIVLVGVVGILILLERTYVIVLRSKNNGRQFIERVIQLVRGGKVDEAIKECASSNAALPDMGLVILRSRSRDESDLQNVADAAALSLVPRLTRRLQYLPMLALVGALLGVLGTVLGVRDALLATASAGADRAQQLSMGLAGALAPTIVGLVIAIVLIVGRSYLVSQADAITEHIREFSARLINALIDRPDVRLGHR
ncbi:MAG TPA: MotA/TolQ/ExbB proton channel family protein [Gemmatimonadaceae bacterium]|jgi:biopolymer transport protein ExbB